MKKILFVLLAMLCLTLAVTAKEIVIYENDFSSTDLSDFKLRGDMEVVNGALKAVKRTATGPSAYASYTFPKEHRGKAYIIDVDIIGHTGTAGLLIGATSSTYTETPSYFSGYACTLGESGKEVFYGIFNETGWGNTLAPSTVTFEGLDLHFKVKVQFGVMTFSVYKLGEDAPLYVSRYDMGSHDDDAYDAFASVAGMRQYYTDGGCFDNFKVTVIEDDIIPAGGTDRQIGDLNYYVNGVTITDDGISGSGSILSRAQISGNYNYSFDLAAKNVSRLYFGMTDRKNGYAFEINEKESAVFLYKIVDGEYSLLGEKENIIRSEKCTVTLNVHSNIATLYYDNLYQNGREFPKFEFYLDGLEGAVGIWLEGGTVSNIQKRISTYTRPEESYINPVNPGADPDVLYHEGVYYLYVYSGNDGKNIFRVYTSPDLVHFTPRNIIFQWEDEYSETAQASTSWSPNVSYYNGTFYLFFAAKRNGVEQRSVYYATSDSPYGPFVFKDENGDPAPLEAVNPNIYNEIDGHPFYDDDGRIYMSFSRYDLGGTIWVEEVKMEGDRVIQLPDTDTRVIVPDREWDNDGITRLCEGGYIWKHKGLYYMVYATTSYARHYGEACAVAESPLGPYEKLDINPFLAENFALDGPGDALIVPSPDGNELYLVYHRHYSPDQVHLRQTCIDLIEFVEDPDGGPDILTVRGPSSTPQRLPSNIYRFDVDRDGVTGLRDALMVIKNLDTGIGGYNGYYDVDANGSVGLGDMLMILDKAING